MFMSVAISFESDILAFWYELLLFIQLLAFWDVSAVELCFLFCRGDPGFALAAFRAVD